VTWLQCHRRWAVLACTDLKIDLRNAEGARERLQFCPMQFG
jgi:hypothetical protein